MANSIGAVDIELLANLVQFRLGLNEAGKTADDFGQQLSRKFKENSEKARGALDLISDSVGVRLPRELKTLIAQVPGLNTALAGALSTAAFAAVIAIAGEAVAKFIEYKEAVQAASDKWHEFLTSNLADQNKQRDALQESVVKLLAADDAVKELRLRLQEMKRDISELSPEVEKFRNAFEEALKPQAKTDTWLNYLELAVSQTAPALGDALDRLRNHTSELASEAKNFHDELSKTASTEGTAAALKLVDDRLTSVYQRIKQFPTDEALVKFKEDLEKLQTAFSTESTKHFTDEQENLRETFKKLSDGAQALRDKVAAVYSDNDPIGEITKRFQTLEAELEKEAREHPEIFRSAFPNDTLETLKMSIDRVKNALIDGELIKGAQDAGKAIKESFEESIKTLNTLTIKPPLPTLAPDAKAPTSLEKTLEQLNSKDPAAMQKATAEQARQVADAVQTQDEKYQEQLEILDKLHASGEISEQQYKVFKNLIDPVAQSWRNFGDEIGNTTRDALLFGRSWSDALKSLLFDLLKVIAQMTILKQLQASSGSGGIGGFFSNLLGGLFGGGHADGGATNPGVTYLVGEHGPELWRAPGSGTIIPNSSLSTAGGAGGKTNVYNIDARGAEPGVEDRIRRAIAESEDRAVVRSVHATSDLQRRR